MEANPVVTMTGLARMQVVLAKVVREHELEGGAEVTIRTLMTAAAMMLEESGNEPVMELLGAAWWLNDESEEPAPVEDLQAFIGSLSQ